MLALRMLERLTRIAQVAYRARSADYAFGASAWLLAPIAEASLMAFGAPRTLGWLQRVPRRARARHDAVTVEDGCIWVQRAFRMHALLPGRCLARAVVQDALHRLDGTSSQLCIGVRRSVDGSPGIDAHAWVDGASRAVDADGFRTIWGGGAAALTGIAAAARLGGRGPSDDVLERQVASMLRALVGPSDDAPRLRTLPGVALGHAWWPTTPEDVARGGAIATRGALTAVVDLRIDNRVELLGALSAPTTIGDPELFLAAWERWGEDTIRRLVGDFGVAVWCARNRRLTLARDGLGIRPLYFARRGEVLLAASELHALGVGEAGVDLDIDPLEATRILMDRYGECPRTLFRGVEAAPTGGVACVEDGSMVRRPIWRLDPFARAPTRPDAEHAEHFRDVLESAVRSKLRRVGGVGVLISGGLDSSSSACLAARAMSPDAASEMRLLHVAFPGFPCDEAPYFDAVVAKTGATPVALDPRDFPEITAPMAPGTPPGEMYDATSAMMWPLLDGIRPEDKTVVLTGAGGDDMLHESHLEFRDELLALDPAAAWKSARREAEVVGSWSRFLGDEVSWLVVPHRVRATIRRLRPPHLRWPDWLTPRAHALIDTWHREYMADYVAIDAPTWTQRRLVFRMSGKTHMHFYTARTDYFGRRFAIDQRHPFYDRRVVEALLATPHHLRFDGRELKAVLRSAMRGILPERVRTRQDAANFNPYTIDRMTGRHRAIHAELLRDCAVEREGLVPRGTFLKMLDDPENWQRPVTRAIAIETSLRTIRDRRATNEGGPIRVQREETSSPGP